MDDGQGVESVVHSINWTFRQARRLIVAIVGMSVLVIGVAMIVLPGPAIVVIPIGLGLLATEFVWARRLLNKIRARFPNSGVKK